MPKPVTSMLEINKANYADLTPELLSSSKPVVLRGLVSKWPLVMQANKSNQKARQYLKQFYNQNSIRTFRAAPEHQGRFFYNDELSGFNFTQHTDNFDTLLDELAQIESLTAPPGVYMGSTLIDHILPGFRAENDIPALADKPLISLWVGNQSRIAAHYDVTENVACVVAGKRRFTLFPPEQLDNLYIGPLDFTPAGQPASLVDFHHPDFEQFPKFREALTHAQVVELEPGDAIFIPSMWWHHVEGLSTFNILINYWWRQVDMHIGAPMDALNHALLSIKDLPKEQRETWRHIFDYYVFSDNTFAHIPETQRGVLNPIDEITARQLRANLINKLNR